MKITKRRCFESGIPNQLFRYAHPGILAGGLMWDPPGRLPPTMKRPFVEAMHDYSHKEYGGRVLWEDA